MNYKIFIVAAFALAFVLPTQAAQWLRLVLVPTTCLSASGWGSAHEIERRPFCFM